MSGAQELDPDDFIPAPCPQCGEFGRPGRLDQHIAKKHADLPPCTASITNEHTNGTIRCVFRVGHRDDEYGDYHAGPYSPDRGRHWWADHAEGAIPHASPNPSEAERNIVHGLYSSGIREQYHPNVKPANLYDDRLLHAEIRAAVAEHEAEAYRNQVQALVRELLRAREVPDEDLPQKVRVIILNEEAP